MVLVLGAGYLGAALAELALARGLEVTLADNWHATDRGQLAELERARRGGRDGRHPRPRGARRAARRRARARRPARRAGQPPAVRARSRLHRADEPHRRAPGGRGGRGLGRGRAGLRQLAARLRAGAARRGRRGPAVRRAGRPRASLEGLRRAGAQPARPARRLRARAAAPGDRLRAEPGRARGARVADGGRQVPPPRRRGRASCPSTTAAGRRSGWCTSPTRPASCSTARCRRPARSSRPTSPPRPSPWPTSPRSRRAASPRTSPRGPSRAQFEYRHALAEYL